MDRGRSLLSYQAGVLPKPSAFGGLAWLSILRFRSRRAQPVQGAGNVRVLRGELVCHLESLYRGWLIAQLQVRLGQSDLSGNE